MFSFFLLTLVANPCSAANCSHLCVLKPLNRYQCLCPFDTTIQDDSRTCNARMYKEGLRQNKIIEI